MTQTASFLTIMKERGYLHQCTDEAGLNTLLNEKTTTAYIGFDCTANSLHVGSLVQIMMLRHFQQCGHKPIILLGSGTTRVGDPSGKDESRKILTEEQINENKQGIKKVFEHFLIFGDGPTDAILLDNADWLLNLNYIEFLRDYGKHFSINRMLAFDSVKLRIEREQTLSFLEFNYMLLQAFDFTKLYKDHHCRLQLGGSDQWGNIVNGIELNRRLGEKELFGLTSPLITTASGAKMGKSSAGAIWLDESLLSAYDYWQFWRNTEDQDVGKFLKLFTELPLEEIEKLEKLEGSDINEAKKILATEATKMLHGEEAANQASQTAQNTFEQGTIDENLPTFEIPKQELQQGIPAYALLVRTELADSNGAARRLIRGSGGKINDKKIEDENTLITLNHLEQDIIKLSAGKKKHMLIKPI